MTLFTEGRLQAFERMMQDTGYPRHRKTEEPERKTSARKFAQDAKQLHGREGGGHADIPG